MALQILFFVSSVSDPKGFSHIIGLMLCGETVHLLKHFPKMRSEISVFVTKLQDLNLGAGELAQSLRALVVVEKGPGLSPSTHMETQHLLGQQTCLWCTDRQTDMPTKHS